MRRGTRALVVVLALLGAGCVGLAPEAAPDAATGTGTNTVTDTGTPTDTATPSPTAASADPVGVEYVVRSGSVPDEFGSVGVTLRVVFVERSGDVGPCWRETFAGPYQPTVPPIAPPSGDCHRSEPVTLDLTETDGERSLEASAPGRFDAGHALVVANATATYPNGTAVRGLRVDRRASVVEGPAAGPYRVRLSITSYRGGDRPYDYWFVAERAAG
jgi:hypothetical protein